MVREKQQQKEELAPEEQAEYDLQRRVFEREWNEGRFNGVKEELEQVAHRLEQIAAQVRREAEDLQYEKGDTLTPTVGWSERLSWIASQTVQGIGHQAEAFTGMAKRMAEAEVAKALLDAQPVEAEAPAQQGS